MKKTNTITWSPRAVWGAVVLLVVLLLSACEATGAGAPGRGPTPEAPGTRTAESFVSKWRVSAGESLTLPLITKGKYDFTVDWGDGRSNKISSGSDQKAATHRYTEAGDYTVIITGTFEGWRLAGYSHADKLIDVEQWGRMALGDTYGHFQGAVNLERFTAKDKPDLSKTTSLASAFRDASKFNGDLSNWDVSTIEDMSYMFSGASSFNGDLSSWDVSTIKDMSSMFFNAATFNQNISAWNVSRVENMHSMFFGATVFNNGGNSLDWNVSRVTNMHSMFFNAAAFTQDISGWVVTSVDPEIGAADAFTGSGIEGEAAKQPNNFPSPPPPPAATP